MPKWESASTSCAERRSCSRLFTFAAPLERRRYEVLGSAYSTSSDSVTLERRLPIGVSSSSSSGSSSAPSGGGGGGSNTSSVSSDPGSPPPSSKSSASSSPVSGGAGASTWVARTTGSTSAGTPVGSPSSSGSAQACSSVRCGAATAANS